MPTLTLLFADLEGSTRLVDALGSDYIALLERYHGIVGREVHAAGGSVVGTEGDGHFVTFPATGPAVMAAVAIQRSVASEKWPNDLDVRTRIGIHPGGVVETSAGLVGIDIHRAARIAGAAHGGQILVSAETVEAATETGEITFTDLGLHRLKDIAEPQRLYQVAGPGLEEEFAPPNTLRDHASNLPLKLTSFVGRTKEASVVEGLLRSHRLVTITGPGGTGKTRLAIHVADWEQNRFVDGAWFVNLVSINNAAAIVPEVARTLDIDLAGTAGDMTALTNELSGWKTLIVLDNCEHLLPELRPIATGLLERVPGLTVLATSRHPIGIAGERVVPLQPLDRRSEAVQLFLDRARLARPGWEPDDVEVEAAKQIIDSVDGLPLGIELAAARLATMSAISLASNLTSTLRLSTREPDPTTPHHQGLAQTIEWSYRLLDADAQSALRALSVFEGLFTMDWASEVLGQSAWELLDDLVAASMVDVDHGREVRFRLLRTIREFAARELDAHPEEASSVIERHSALVRARLEELSAAQQRGAEIDEIMPDAVASLDRAIDAGDLEVAVDIAAGLVRRWYRSGRAEEAASRLEMLIERPLPPSPSSADVLRFAAIFRIEAGLDPGTLIERQEAAARTVGSPAHVARAINIRAGLLWRAGRLDDAAAAYQEAIDAAGSESFADQLRINLGFVKVSMGQLDQAESLAATVTTRPAEVSRLRGEVEFWRGDLSSAERAFREALELAETDGDATLASLCRLELAYVAWAKSDLDDLLDHVAAARTSAGRGAAFQHAEADALEAVARHRLSASEARELAERGLQTFLASARPEGVAMCCLALAAIDRDGAHWWAEASRQLCAAMAYTMAPPLARYLDDISPGTSSCPPLAERAMALAKSVVDATIQRDTKNGDS